MTATSNTTPEAPDSIAVKFLQLLDAYEAVKKAEEAASKDLGPDDDVVCFEDFEEYEIANELEYEICNTVPTNMLELALKAMVVASFIKSGRCQSSVQGRYISNLFLAASIVPEMPEQIVAAMKTRALCIIGDWLDLEIRQ